METRKIIGYKLIKNYPFLFLLISLHGFCQEKQITLSEYRQVECLNQFHYYKENANVALIVGVMMSYNIFAYRNSMSYPEKAPKYFFGSGVLIDIFAWRKCIKFSLQAYHNKKLKLRSII